MRTAHTWDWPRTRRYDEQFNKPAPSSPRQFFPDYIIATPGYDFQEGQHLADGGRLRFSLYLDHFGLLSWVVTADRAATTTTPRRPSGAGGSEEQSIEESGFVEMVDIDGIQKCVDLLHDCIQE
jgi:hypothetical protein